MGRFLHYAALLAIILVILNCLLPTGAPIVGPLTDTADGIILIVAMLILFFVHA